MQLRCYRCGWSFAIKKDEIVFAIETLQESGGVHYDVRCPRCRQTNKLALEQLLRSAPRIEEDPKQEEAAEEAAEEAVEEAVEDSEEE